MTSSCQVNGIRIAVEDTGRGVPLVLVHGSWGSHHNWDRVVPGLAEDHRVISYDRRGHSESERVAGQGTFAEDVADSAHGVVVHEPPLRRLLPLNGAEEPLRTVLRLIRAGDHAGAAQRFVEDVALGPGAWAQLPEQVRATMADNAPTFLDEELAPDSRDVDEEALVRYSGPLLVSSGGRSPRIFQPVAPHLLRLLPQAHRVEYADAGHVPQMTHPQAFVREVRAFLATAA